MKLAAVILAGALLATTAAAQEAPQSCPTNCQCGQGLLICGDALPYCDELNDMKYGKFATCRIRQVSTPERHVWLKKLDIPHTGTIVDPPPARASCMPRPPDLTYGGLAPMPGFQRDHIKPLGLGGSDTIDNVNYQTLAKAREKNDDERHAERMVCYYHNWSPDYALGWLAGRWPVDVEHGYLMQSTPQ